MKAILSITSIMFVCLFGFAQSHAIQSTGQHPPFANFINQVSATQAHSRSGTPVIINYNDFDAQYANSHGGTYRSYWWNLNKNYADDASNSYNLNYAVVAVDTIVDDSSGYGFSLTSTNFIADSIQVPYKFTRTANGNDTAIITVYATPSGLTLNPNNVSGTISNTALLVQKFPLTTNTAGDYLTIRPNVPFTPGYRVAIAIDYVGSTADTFSIIAGGANYCSDTCGAALGVIRNTAAYKCILWQGNTDFTFASLIGSVYFDCDGSGGLTPNVCEQFYIQNISMNIFLTLSSPVSLSAAITGNANFCSGQADTLTALPFGGTAPYSYQWSNGANTPSITFTAQGTYRVTITDANSATSTAQLFANLINCNICTPDLTVTQPGVYPDMQYIPCIVQNVPYNASLTYKSYPSITYSGLVVPVDSIRIDSITNLPCGITWTCDKTPNNTYMPNELGCIKLSGTTTDAVGQYDIDVLVTLYISGLGTLPGAFSNLGKKLILRVKATTGASCPNVDTSITGLTSSGPNCALLPLAITIGGSTQFCASGSTTLTANATGANGSYTYSWSTGSSSQSITVTSAGTYSVTVSSGGLVTTDSVTATTLPPSVSTVALAATPNPACAGQQLTFVATPSSAGNGSSFTWLVNNNIVSTTSDTTYSTSSLSAGDEVKVVYYSNLPCASLNGDTSNVVAVAICSGIDEAATVEQSVSLYPNPNNGKFVLDVTTAFKHMSIEIFDLQGKRVYSEKLKDVATGKRSFELNDFAKGVYQVRISTESGTATKKLVVE